MNIINSCKNQSSYRLGFSLIETSVIVFLISAIILSYLSWTNSPVTSDGIRILTTQQKINKIQQAIEIFLQTNGRLPCPAKRDQAIETAYSYSSNTITYDDEYISYNSTRSIDCAISIGAIPTRILGLPADYMTDGWDRRFTYHVTPAMCGNTANGCTPKDFNSNEGAITIKSSAGGSNIVTNAAYVIVSYGADGYGAYLPSGSVRQSPPAGNTDETENTNSDTTYVQKALTSGFTNIVEYKTKQQLVHASNALSNNSIITSAECAANSTMIAAMDSTQASSLRTAITATRRCRNAASCASNYDTYGDQAVLDIFWVVQDACYELYGNRGSLSRSCAAPWTSFSSANSCCPTLYGVAQGRTADCTVQYMSDVNACIVTNYSMSSSNGNCWYVN
jgi:hypothetical protein